MFELTKEESDVLRSKISTIEELILTWEPVDGKIKHTVKRVRKDAGKWEKSELVDFSEREHPRLKVKEDPKRDDK